MTTVTFSLPESLKQFHRPPDRRQSYGNVSVCFRSLLRDAPSGGGRLEALMLEGLASGDDIPLTREFWTELKTEARQFAANHTSRKKRS